MYLNFKKNRFLVENANVTLPLLFCSLIGIAFGKIACNARISLLTVFATVSVTMKGVCLMALTVKLRHLTSATVPMTTGQ